MTASAHDGGTEGRGGCETAFALGGGSNPGAHEIGMMWPLSEAGIRPDLVVGTSAGAVNAALVAAFPGAAAVHRLAAVWNGLARTGVFGALVFGRIGTAMRSGAHLCSSVPLRALVEPNMPVRRIDGLEMPLQCVAAMLQVGWIERPLLVPGRPWEVAAVAFEVARRHRFARGMAELPDRVTVHVLLIGRPGPDRAGLTQHLRYRSASLTRPGIDAAYRAPVCCLSELAHATE